MSIKAYIRYQREWLVTQAAVLTVINLILFASIPLGKSPGEIFYLDLLLAVIMLGGFFCHYYRTNQAYKKMIRQAEADSDVMGIELARELLDRAAAEFSGREREYRRKMNDMKDYLTHTVHDLKVNLAVCEMVVKRLGDIPDTNRLIYQIEQMKYRISQALSITRANHYSTDIMPEPIDMEQVVRDALRDNREFFIAGGIAVSIDIQAYSVVSDRKWVHYIISQILNNSSKYTKEGGEVAVSSSLDNTAYHLHIKDNGIGIPAEETARIFDKGFTGTNGRLGTKSSGMGMYYAGRMAENLGIGLHAVSEDRNGTEFIVSFYHLSDYLKRKSREGDENVT